MKDKSTIETYEDQKQRTAVFNLTSDLFAGKVFKDIGACQELCRILLKNEHIALRNVKTQYVIRNLENHSVELDILAEVLSGKLINVELQMYREPAPFKSEIVLYNFPIFPVFPFKPDIVNQYDFLAIKIDNNIYVSVHGILLSFQSESCVFIHIFQISVSVFLVNAAILLLLLF